MIMEIDDITYDVDNVDVEEELYARECEEEEMYLDAQAEEAEEAEEEEAELNESNLDMDMLKTCETDRRVYSFKKDGVPYRGYVIYKMSKGVYVFSVEDNDTSCGRKSKKFSLDDIS